MDALIDQLLNGYGPLGVIAVAVLVLMRGQIAEAMRPSNETHEDSVKALHTAVAANTRAIEAQTEQFRENNRLFLAINGDVHALTRDASSALDEMRELRIALVKIQASRNARR